MKNLRNVEINGTSPIEDILAALTGVWSKTEINGWAVIHLSCRLEIWQKWCNKAETILLPRTAETTMMAKVFNNDGSVAGKLIKIGDKALKVTKPCYLEILVVTP